MCRIEEYAKPGMQQASMVFSQGINGTEGPALIENKPLAAFTYPFPHTSKLMQDKGLGKGVLFGSDGRVFPETGQPSPTFSLNTSAHTEATAKPQDFACIGFSGITSGVRGIPNEINKL